MRAKTALCLVGILIIILSGLPASTFAQPNDQPSDQPGKGLAIELTPEVAGDDTIKVHVTVHNIDTNDLGPIYVTGFIPDGARLEQSWAGSKVGENQGNFGGNAVNWFNNYIKSERPPAGSTFVPGPLIYHYVLKVPTGMLVHVSAQVRWEGANRGTAKAEVLTSAGPVITPGVQPAAGTDYALSNGWFYKQANGQGGQGDKGFAVVDGGPDGGGGTVAMWTAYKNFGGPQTLGYPISRRFRDQVNDTFQYQAFQKGIIQWDSVSHSARLVNLMDALHDAGLDPQLEQKMYPPWEPDNAGGDFAKAREERLSWLSDPAYSDLAQAYFSTPNYEQLLGLPAAHPKTYGTTRVLRLQRAVLASYNNGPVIMASIGDDAKSLGYLSGDSIQPQDPTERDLAAWTFRTAGQVQAVAQTTAQPPQYKYYWEWVEVKPNCSHTFLEGTLRDGYNNPVYGEKVKTWNDWGNEAISIAGAWGPGGWQRDMGDGIRPGTWHIQVLNPNTGNPLSPVFDVRFTDSCGSGGVQEIILHLRAYPGF
ncbi:MAG: hypothetical protein M1531_02090 [Chloroflexi bacterium]|nr:hypothetical protein [Chloroflexota bacterium]